MGAREKDVVEAFIHDEICRDIPGSKGSSYVPATSSVTLRRGQEILLGDWYACYESIERGSRASEAAATARAAVRSPVVKHWTVFCGGARSRGNGTTDYI